MCSHEVRRAWPILRPGTFVPKVTLAQAQGTTGAGASSSGAGASSSGVDRSVTGSGSTAPRLRPPLRGSVAALQHRGDAFAVGFHAPYQARAVAVALDHLGESACGVFKAYQAEGPLDDFPRVQLWVPTADREASEIPRWMHRLIKRQEWRGCETKEELLARHTEWLEEDENKIFF